MFPLVKANYGNRNLSKKSYHQGFDWGTFAAAQTFCKTTQSIMTLSIMTLSITTLSMMTLSIYDTQHI
jgi:hypothetical protein